MDGARKTSRVLLASAARTADAAGPRLAAPHHHAARLYLTVTVAPGAGGLQVFLRGYDSVSGTAVEMSSGGPSITQTGTYVYELRPGPETAPFGGIVEIVNRTLPVDWDAIVKHGDASSYTYSLSCELSRP